MPKPHPRHVVLIELAVSMSSPRLRKHLSSVGLTRHEPRHSHGLQASKLVSPGQTEHGLGVGSGVVVVVVVVPVVAEVVVVDVVVVVAHIVTGSLVLKQPPLTKSLQQSLLSPQSAEHEQRLSRSPAHRSTRKTPSVPAATHALSPTMLHFGSHGSSMTHRVVVVVIDVVVVVVGFLHRSRLSLQLST